MKINMTMIFAVLRYWVQNGKTMTALVTGFAVVALREAGLEQFAPDAVELVAALVTAGTLGVIGILDKIRKFIAEKQAEQAAEVSAK